MIPLSFAQSRLWFLYRYEGPSVTYNQPVVLRLRAEVDPGLMALAVRDVVLRHESLRTVIGEDERGVAFQTILPPDEVVIQVPTRTVGPEQVAGAIAEAVEYRFELETEIPIRVSLLACGPEEYVLVILMHHIAGDGASMAPLARDLSMAYMSRGRGTGAGLGAAAGAVRGLHTVAAGTAGRAVQPEERCVPAGRILAPGTRRRSRSR